LVTRQVRAACLDHLSIRVQRRRNGGCGKLQPSHARRFQHMLLLGAEAVDLLPDELPNAYR
jgi:hypothetical protein